MSSWTRTSATIAASLGAVGLVVAALSTGQMGSGEPTFLCGNEQLTEPEIAAKFGVTVDKLHRAHYYASVTNESLCTMQPEHRAKAFRKADQPKPDHPGEAVAFRNMYYRDEDGTIPENGLLNAKAQLDQLRATPGMVAPGAGITSGSWTALGPGNIGGRVRSILIDPSNGATMLIGSVSGGIWRTTNSGGTWAAVQDFMANLAVSTMVAQPSDFNTQYAGTGEGFYNIDGIRGAGIFKSTDGGTSWAQLASTTSANFQFVNRLAMSPNSTTLLAATRTGIFRSTDGGATFPAASLAAPGAQNGVTDVDFHPTDSTRAVAGGYAGNAWYSTDGGATFVLASGLPGGGTFIRVETAFAPSSPNIVYASVDTAGGAIYKSTDFGATYTFVFNGSPDYLGGQGWYDNALFVDPTNPNFLIVGGIDLYKSTDGGVSFTKISAWQNWPASAHADHHIVVPVPGFNGTSVAGAVFGSDGGIYTTTNIYTVGNNSPNFTAGWQELNNNLAITQFYGAGAHEASGKVMGGTQDNGTLTYTMATGFEGWVFEFGGDGGWSAIDQNDPNYCYGEYVYLTIHRSSTGCGANSGQFIFPGIGDANNPNLANFISPFILDPNDQSRLLAGGRSLWRTSNAKAATVSWASIKAAHATSNISAIAVQRGNADHIWVGHNNGDLYKTINGTAVTPTWNLMDTGLPNRVVTRVAVDETNDQIIYVTFGGYSTGNIWKSTNGGTTWTSIHGSLPAAPIRGIAIHPNNSNWLYIGTEVGIFASEDAGGSWTIPHDGPANVSVDEVFFSGSTLYAATHGRGIYQATLAVRTIVRFDAPASTASEGSSSQATVRLVTPDGNPTTSQVTVQFATVAGSAAAGSDFVSDTGALEWPTGTPSETTRTIDVQILDDLVDELDETFTIVLTNPVGADTVGNSHAITITDDDPPPLMEIRDASAAEGGAGTTLMTFDVRLSGVSGRPVTVDYMTADGSAVAAEQTTTFVNPAPIGIPDSGTSTPYPSSIVVSGVSSNVSKLTIELSSFSHTFPADVDILLVGPSGVGVILMSDVGGSTDASNATLRFDAGGALLAEPIISGTYRPTNIGSGDSFPSPAPAGAFDGNSLTSFSGFDPNGTWRLYVVDDAGGDIGTIAGGWSLTIETGDYLPTSGQLVFDAGVVSRPIAVPVVGDTRAEPSETFSVMLSNAVNAIIGDAVAQGTISDTVAPGPFGKIAPLNGATGVSTSPTLSWGASTGATTYEYCVDTTNDNTCSAWTSVGTTTSVGLTGLTANTPYYWQVRATNGGGTTYADGAATAFWNFTTQVAAPGPFGKIAPANGATGVPLTPTLSWGASTGATGYEYCVDTTNDNICSAWTSVGTTTSVGLTGLTAGTTYYWHVRASTGGITTYADGSATAFWNFTTLAAPGPFGKIAPLNGATGVSTSPTLSWGASTGATTYEYCVDTTNDNTCSAWTSVGTTTSVGLTGLTANTTYYWQVRATNGGGTTYADGAATAFWNFTTQVVACAFGKIAPPNGATGVSTSPTLSWGTCTGATSYEYCIDTTNDNTCSPWINAGANTSVGLTGRTAGTTYYWQVRATSSGGTTYADGAATAFWNFTTQAAAPTPMLVAGLGTGGSGWIGLRRGLDQASTWLQVPWSAYAATGGGVHVATGNLDADALDEIVVGLGPGGNGWIAVLDDGAHDHVLLRWVQVPWQQYNTENGEVYPAVGDIDGDGHGEIVAGLGDGSSGWFALFEGANQGYAFKGWQRVNWPTYTSRSDASTHPAVADVDSDGLADIVLGLGQGSNGWLEVRNAGNLGYSTKTWLQASWSGYNAQNGTTYPAASGELLVIGLGSGGDGWLEVRGGGATSYAHQRWLRTTWDAYNAANGETHPALGNLIGSAAPELVVGLDHHVGEGGWFEVIDPASGASLGWRNVDWATFRAAGGALWPAVGNLR